MPGCRSCGAERPAAATLCRRCERERLRMYRTGTQERRLWTNLKQRLLQKEERAAWSFEDVVRLLAEWEPPAEMPRGGRAPRLRVVAVDKASPLLPGNARIALFGAAT